MSPTTTRFDGLWLYLCPVLRNIPVRAVRFPPVIRNYSIARHSTSAIPRQPYPPTEATPSPASPEHDQSQLDHNGKKKDPRTARFSKMALYRRESQPGHGMPARVWQTRMKLPQDFETRPNTNLENIMQRAAGDRCDLSGTITLIRELIEKRGVPPQLRHYKSMILANADAYLGSPIQVRSLLEEMEDNGIPADSATLHAALKVLAIHPDYVLRQEILRTLRDRWLPLSPAGWHNVVTGLIRERQYELALDTLEKMEAQGITVNEWLWDLLVYNLCDSEDFDEVLLIMQNRVLQGEPVWLTLWYHVLDSASCAYHEPCVEYVWERRVETGVVNPGYGICENVLTITSRTGNTELAKSVFRVMAEREYNISVYNYDALIDTYITAGDLESAFKVLCSLVTKTLTINETSTRSIFTYLLHTNPNPWTVWSYLKRLHEEEQTVIPVAAVNVVLELCAHKKVMTIATDLYKELHTICTSGPNTLTFNHLLNGCRRTASPGFASFFVLEMIHLKVLPNRDTYEILILLCVENGRYKEGYQYLVEMTNSGFGLTEAARTRVRTLCYDADDRHAKLLQYDAHVRKPIARMSPPRPKPPQPPIWHQTVEIKE